MRILITGSRDWSDSQIISDAVITAARAANVPPDGVVIVHGACPRGADALAHEFAERHGLRIEQHPAVWSDKGAGFRRNQAMVDVGADVCLAFIKPCTKSGACQQTRGDHGSHGASHCAAAAEQAGIDTRYYRES